MDDRRGRVLGALQAGTPDAGEYFDAASRLKLELNDRDNGIRLAAVASDDLLYVPGMGWGVWDGRRFDFDAGEEKSLKVAAVKIPAALMAEAAAKSAKGVDERELSAYMAANEGLDLEAAISRIKAGRRKSYSLFALNCGNNAKAKAALEAARPQFLAEVSDLNSVPWCLTCENGVLDLDVLSEPPPVDEEPEERAERMGAALGDFDPSMRGTRKPAVKFDPAAECPRWRRFVSLAFPPDAGGTEDADYFRRAMSTALFGLNERQIALIFLGQGGNGKTTASNALQFILGGYAATCRIELFLESKYASSSGPTPEEAVLPGARAYIAEEPEASAVLSASKIKGMTGGSTRQSRPLHGKPFNWVPNGIPVLAFNKMPRINDESEGMWRRLVPIHFTQRLHELPVGQKMTPGEVERAVREEASGILNWLLEGWVDLCDRAGRPGTLLQGLDPPASVLELKSQMRAMADPVGEFLADCTDKVIGGRIGATELHKVYELWCAENGAEPVALRTLSRTMQAKDYIKRKAGTMSWLNVAWIPGERIDQWLDKIKGGGGV